jgi:hypothetical protein
MVNKEIKSDLNINNQMEEYVPYEELYKAYIDCRKNKRNTCNAIIFEMDEALNLIKLYEDLNKKKYEIGRSIAFLVYKPVPREVFAADFRDRIVHHLLMNRTIELFENNFIQDAYSCRDGKGTEYGVLRCRKFIEECSDYYHKPTYILKCDLKSFFMTISKSKLYSKAERFLTDSGKFNAKDLEFNLWLCRQIIFNDPTQNCIRKQPESDWKILPKEKSLFCQDKDCGLPIGNLTSQIFANFYLSEFDHWITEELGFKYYGRYVDDFFILDNDKEKLKSIVNVIREKLKTYGVTLHPNKLYIQEVRKGVQFIGTIIKPNRMYIINRTLGNLYDRLNELEREYKDFPDDKDLIHKISCVINSYLGFMKHRKTFNLRYKIFKKWKNIRFIFNFMYVSDNLDKVTVFKEYCTLGDNKEKHMSKDEYRNYLFKKFLDRCEKIEIEDIYNIE